MADLVRIHQFDVCAKEAGGFDLCLLGGTLATIEGCVFTCSLRLGPAAGQKLFDITPEIPTPSNKTVQFRWTAEQAAAMSNLGGTYVKPAIIWVEINMAYADSPTEPSLRFAGPIGVYGGGEST